MFSGSFDCLATSLLLAAIFGFGQIWYPIGKSAALIFLYSYNFSRIYIFQWFAMLEESAITACGYIYKLCFPFHVSQSRSIYRLFSAVTHSEG